MPITTRPRRALIAVFVAIVAAGAFASPAQAAYTNPPASSVSDQTPAAGSSLEFCGSGFQANETVTIALDNGTTFPSVVADSSGAFCTTVVLGASLSGKHTITATGASSGRTSSTEIQVAGVGATADTATGSLALTGATVLSIGALALMLLVGGALMMLAGRRRKVVA